MQSRVRQKVFRFDIKNVIHMKKLIKFDLIKIKIVCSVKHTVNRMKRQITGVEDILQPHNY